MRPAPPLLAILTLTSACSTDVAGLEDCCVLDAAAPLDARPLDAAPAPPLDAGQPDVAPLGIECGVAIDVGTLPDAGEPPLEGCALGWTELATAAPGGSVIGHALAAGPDGFALPWSRAGASTSIAYLSYFDAQGRPIAGPHPVVPGVRVVAYGDRYLIGAPTSVSLHGLHGETLDVLQQGFVPRAVVGDRAWGLLFGRVAWLDAAQGLVDTALHSTPVEPRGRVVGFGPDRFVVASEPRFGEPAVLELYTLVPQAPPVRTATLALPVDDVNGEPHVAEVVSAVSWNAAESRFELLVGVRLGSTRQFGARLLHLDDRGLHDGPPLYAEPTSVAYEGLVGALAVGAQGTRALAYRSPYSASALSLDRVRGAAVEHVALDSGAAYPTAPMLAAFGDRFAVAYGAGAAGTSTFETRLRLRCDLAQ